MNKLIAVYGTLRRGFYNHDRFGVLGDYLGCGMLDGFRMHDLGPFPMVRVCPDSKIFVEVYRITEETYNCIDRMERGSGYEAIPVTIHGSETATVWGAPAGREVTKPEVLHGVWTKEARKPNDVIRVPESPVTLNSSTDSAMQSRMATTPRGVKVIVGQTWQDRDRRMDGRKCEVLEVRDGKARMSGFPSCWTSIRRMDRAWTLLKDVPAKSVSIPDPTPTDRLLGEPDVKTLFIGWIKWFRGLTGLSLMESKAAADRRRGGLMNAVELKKILDDHPDQVQIRPFKVGDIVSPKTEEDAHSIQCGFHGKVTIDTELEVLVTEDAETHRGKESGVIVSRVRKEGELSEDGDAFNEVCYPYVWNFDRFLFVRHGR
jgi:gamma-glutamylcyclotransferase (GGCT)/AIG2-like uncharacterized protein YtfP